MSYAPQTILNVRHLIQGYVPSLSNVELGIVGDDSHAASGSSYHLGRDALKAGSYSVIESMRDSVGLTNAASALDIGWFTLGAFDLRDLSVWLVAECRAGAADTRDIREIIYSPDGQNVKRFDDLGIRSSGDDSHLTHTHISWYRDSESRSKTSLFQRWFTHIKGDDPVTPAEIEAIAKRSADLIVARELTNTLTVNNHLVTTYNRTGALANTQVPEALARLARVEAILSEFVSRAPATPVPTVVTQEQVTEALRTVLREGLA